MGVLGCRSVMFPKTILTELLRRSNCGWYKGLYDTAHGLLGTGAGWLSAEDGGEAAGIGCKYDEVACETRGIFKRELSPMLSVFMDKETPRR